MSLDQPTLTAVVIQAYSYGEGLGLVFFGFTLLGVGYLNPDGITPRST